MGYLVISSSGSGKYPHILVLLATMQAASKVTNEDADAGRNILPEMVRKLTSAAVAHHFSLLTDTHPADFSPLDEWVDTERLNNALSPGTELFCECGSFEFDWDGVLVTIWRDGRLRFEE